MIQWLASPLLPFCVNAPESRSSPSGCPGGCLEAAGTGCCAMCQFQGLNFGPIACGTEQSFEHQVDFASVPQWLVTYKLAKVQAALDACRTLGQARAGAKQPPAKAASRRAVGTLPPTLSCLLTAVPRMYIHTLPYQGGVTVTDERLSAHGALVLDSPMRGQPIASASR
jgi:hypothetical protein